MYDKVICAIVAIGYSACVIAPDIGKIRPQYTVDLSMAIWGTLFFFVFLIGIFRILDEIKDGLVKIYKRRTESK